MRLLLSILVYAVASFVLVDSSSAQTILTDETNTTGFNDCTQLSLGTTMEFDSSNTCGAIIQLSYYSNPSSLVVPDTVIDYTSADIPFTLSFDRPGKYIFQCSIDPDLFPSSRFNNFADQCFDVVAAEPIPTLGEWGLIMLMLSMLIVSVVASKTFQFA